MDALQRQREQFMREQFAALAAKKELGEQKRREKAAKREEEERARLRAQAAPAVPAKPRAGPPVMFLVKKVLDALQAGAPAAVTAAQLKASCGVDLVADAEVQAQLVANAKVKFDPAGGGRYSYRATFAVANKAQLLALLSSRPEGTSLKALADSYSRVAYDVDDLVEEGLAWSVEDSVTGDRAIFPRDKAYEVEVDERIKHIWLTMEIPTEPDAFARELERAGIVPAPRRSTFARRVMPLDTQERKKKKKRDFSKLHVTNVHLWDELFAPGADADLPEED